MSRPQWSETDVPDQRGRTIVITGANTGLGFQAARVLAGHGATLVLACRSAAKAADAADRLRALVPASTVSTLELDLSCLDSVRAAAHRLREQHERIDVLINNAGMLGSPERTVSADGLEATFATNHLGVFAFTGLILDRLIPVPGSRIVTVTSLTHRLRSATIDFEDLQSQKRYKRDAAYGRSKLANLMFTYELQRQLTDTGAPTFALAAHPGQSRTEFTRGLNTVGQVVYGPRMRHLTGLVMHDATIGVLGEIRAAVDPEATPGSYYGPSGPFQLTGHPVQVPSSARSHDAQAQRRLWDRSEELTGVHYPLQRATAP